MSRILIVSDIHIYDYPQRNPSNRYRLYQSRNVAKNIIEAGKNEGCERIIIAGDVIEKFDAKPYILAETKLFLDTIMREFKEGYIIWGNHDMDNKSVDSEFIDSSLSVMLPPNLYYADKKEVTIDGCRIGFSNYRSEFDLSWIQGCLDVLITHATISYSASDHVHPQQLDESKFNLAICGDIHRPANSGKFVSIGIPQKCKMGDFDNATAIVFDCPSKQYKWVDLNPHDNLMKFQYTDERTKEGWNPSTGIWSVYKPASIEVNSGQTIINIPAWTEIDNLVSHIIQQANLQDLHNKVLTGLRGNNQDEVDFNFTLKKLRCKNWRSIDECEIYFDEGDKYLISGANGSGKSSFLSALKYAFIEYPHYKEFIQFGAKSCETEVEFIYQGNVCRILRGSNVGGCWINDVALKYNNKDEFKKDMHERFPFIDYIEDVCFFNSDHPNFIGSLKPERKSEIVSKFYKIDKIESFNKQAQIMLEELRGSMSQWQQEIDKNERLLTYINEKLSFITIPSVALDVLELKKEEGLRMQEKYMLYTQYMTKTADLQAQLKTSQERCRELEQTIQTFRDQNEIKAEIKKRQDKISEIMSKYQELNSVIKNGQELCDNYRDLGKTKICKTCGQVIAPGADLEKHKAELMEQIQKVAAERDQIYLYFTEHLGMTQADIMSGKFQDVTNKYNSEIAQLMSEINNMTITKNELDRQRNTVKQVTDCLAQIGPQPEKIVLPNGFMEEMGNIEAMIQAWNTYNGYITDKETADRKIGECKAQLMTIRQAQNELNDYIQLTGPTGKIFEEIMTKLAEQFSDNKVHYKVEKWTFRRQEHLELTSYYNNNGNDVPYSQCSDGQRTILDVDFLGKIVTRTGIMVMDEFLKYLDGDNLDIVVDAIKSMNVGCLFLSSHASGIPKFYNRSITTSLNESGVTSVNII